MRNTKFLFVEEPEEQWQLINQAFRRFPEINLVRSPTIQAMMALQSEWTDQEWDLPNLILFDLYMPQRSQGLELLEQLKHPTSPCRHIPVVILSSSSKLTDIEDAYQLGASFYLQKPNSLSGWTRLVREMDAYWLRTARLPPLHF